MCPVSAWAGLRSQPTYEELKRLLLCSFRCFFLAFPAYLWGIETRLESEKLKEAIAVPSLPMRNWNPKPAQDVIPLSLGSQPTYEELKPCISPPPGQQVHVPSLPMRNWNSLLFSSTRRPRVVPSLPMRNWNRNNSVATFTVSMFPAYLWGIETGVQPSACFRSLRSQPTYEQLKQPSVRTTSRCSSRSQPTYEELKRYREGLATLRAEVPSLPMRNWNKITSSPVITSGIVPSLPMRNWNRRRKVMDFMDGACSQPTYEELKLWWK